MEELGFCFEVQPPGPPFDNQPIPLVEDIQNVVFDKGEKDALLQRQSAARRPIPFPEYVENALAVYIAPHAYSYGDLIRSIAQQDGSAHEDIEVDKPLAQLSQINIGGDESHLAVLMIITKLVIKVGTQFIEFVVEEYGYQPKYFKDSE